MSDRETPFGFTFGAAEVVRVMSHYRVGVVIQVRTTHQAVEIRVSPSGRVVQVQGPVRLRAGKVHIAEPEVSA